MSLQLKLVALFSTGCLIAFAPYKADTSQDGDKKINIRGTVTKMTTAKAVDFKPSPLAVVLIEGDMYKDTDYDKASVKITEMTTIKKMVGKELKDAKLEDIKQGCMVEASFSGPVLESYPVQATAKGIVILEATK